MQKQPHNLKKLNCTIRKSLLHCLIPVILFISSSQRYSWGLVPSYLWVWLRPECGVNPGQLCVQKFRVTAIVESAWSRMPPSTLQLSEIPFSCHFWKWNWAGQLTETNFLNQMPNLLTWFKNTPANQTAYWHPLVGTFCSFGKFHRKPVTWSLLRDLRIRAKEITGLGQGAMTIPFLPQE